LINLKRVELFIDLSDFVFFIGHHQNLTGIQRVQANFVRGLQSIEDLTPHYICWNRRLGAFDVLDSEYLLAILADFDFQELARSTTFDKRAAQDRVLPRSRPLDIPAVSIVFLDPKDATGCQALVESPYRFTGS
jgi:hypothetical protein